MLGNAVPAACTVSGIPGMNHTLTHVTIVPVPVYMPFTPTTQGRSILTTLMPEIPRYSGLTTLTVRPTQALLSSFLVRQSQSHTHVCSWGPKLGEPSPIDPLDISASRPLAIELSDQVDRNIYPQTMHR